MGNTSFLFPGQGSQEVGMGIDVSEKFESAARVFKTADDVLGFSITKLIKEGPAEELRQTVNTQPAVVTASLALLAAAKEMGFSCQAAAGHSVGEFAALHCAGVLTLEDTISLTRARGEYMQTDGEKYPGTLSAVIGLPIPKVEEVCTEASKKSVVVVANLNCPGQVVISGSMTGIEEAGRLAQEAGATKVIPLNVSAAFHSPLMNEAAQKLAEKLDQVKFSDAQIPVYCNVTGEPTTSGEIIRGLMKKQIISQVLWESGIRKMMSDGICRFIEIGPGTALSGMIKRIDRKTAMMSIQNLATLEKTADLMKKEEVCS